MSLARGTSLLGSVAAYGPVKGKSPFGFAPYSAGRVKSSSSRPVVNLNHINPAKTPFDGGISFKNMLQEKISAHHIGRPVKPGDIVYTCTRIHSGRSCTLTIPCLGAEHVYVSDTPGKDEKQAGQMAAAKALEKLFPEVRQAAVEAHSNGQGSAQASDGSKANVDPNGEPKSLLNRLVQLAAGRQVQSGDVVYETKWRYEAKGYVSVLKIQCLAGGVEKHTYQSDLKECKDSKQAEKDAARKALEANKASFEIAEAAHERKKRLDAQRIRAKGYGKSQPAPAPSASAAGLAGLSGLTGAAGLPGASAAALAGYYYGLAGLPGYSL